MDGVEYSARNMQPSERICATDAKGETVDCIRHDCNVQQCGIGGMWEKESRYGWADPLVLQ